MIIIIIRCKFKKLYIKFRKKIFLAMKSQLISCFMFRFNPCKYIQCMSLLVIMLFVNFNKSSSLYFPSNRCFILWQESFEMKRIERKSIELITPHWLIHSDLILILKLSCGGERERSLTAATSSTRKYYCVPAGPDRSRSCLSLSLRSFLFT